ncbi:MAG TPA: trypsin-like peptidase domain-containing protein [Candidatus Nanoarchaeia archaeon]|nr:trypsin-like peptidase domain-containing protein [Candidatus Nanoarchaeia archaeon]
MFRKQIHNTIVASALILIILGGLSYYFSYRMEVMQKDYDSKIAELDKKSEDDLNQLGRSLAAKIDAVRLNLSSELGLISTSLQNFKGQNQKEIKTLSDLIDQIEQQSNIQLNELKDQVTNIRIKSADFTAIVNDVLQSVVSISTNTGQASGVIINSKGYVVTNVHVISGATVITVTTNSGSTYSVKEIIGYNANADIAVLLIDAPGLKALPFGNSDKLEIGEKVIAAGNPAGLSFTVTEGIVSALRKLSNGVNYIQTDVPINPGNSGGPLINTNGEIVGINDFKVGGFESLGFAIASNDVNTIATEIIRDYEAKQIQ